MTWNQNSREAAVGRWFYSSGPNILMHRSAAFQFLESDNDYF